MSALLFLLPLILLWVLMIRPQQQRMRQTREMAASLAPGDEVVTAGGIYGTVTAADGEVLSVEIAPGVVVRVLRGAIAQRVSPPPDDDVDADGDAGTVDSAFGDDDA